MQPFYIIIAYIISQQFYLSISEIIFCIFLKKGKKIS
nr:MAG TPA: hypothetical protein [Caudoviricetes sp.]